MVVFTYHRIGNPDGLHDLFTVSEKTLSAHLDLAEQCGYSPGSFDLLQQGHWDARSFYVSFDDATLDHRQTIAPLLDQRGISGVFFIPTAVLSRPGRLNSNDCRALSEAGHMLGSHSHDHRRLDTLPDDAITVQLETSCGILENLTGRRPAIFAPPGGFINSRVSAAGAKCGFRMIRTMRWGLNKRGNPLALETIPVNSSLSLNRLERILRGRGLLRLKLLYRAKETAKKILSPGIYERCRRRLLS